MILKKINYIIAFILVGCLIGNIEVYCKTKHSSKRTTTESLEIFSQLADRILGNDLTKNITFILDSNEKSGKVGNRNRKQKTNEYFLLSSEESKLIIHSNTKSGLSRGLYYYMKEFMNSSISWNGDNIQSLQSLPIIQSEIHIETPFKLRYMLNYCTYSYSMSFWDWQRWEREIDWMALQGINMPLSIIGTGKIWQNTLLKLNYTLSEILDFIPGPAFEAWWLMGNLEGYGGPVTQGHIDGQAQLQQKILERMRQFGMEPVLQGFYGMVPNSLKQKYPESKIYGDQTWQGFRRPAFLDANEELFTKIANIFYKESEKLYGRAKYYGGDPFHEGAVVPGLNLTSQAISIYKHMEFDNNNSSNNKVVWVLQSWQENPTTNLLKGLKKDECIIIDMMAEARSKWQTDAFTDHNFIWSSLPNFGMRIGQYGMVEQYVSQPIQAFNKKNQTMKGIGSIPEGILTNVLDYEILYDFAWHESSQSQSSLTPRQQVQKYLQNFIRFRYGETNNKNIYTAWSLLTQSIYNSDNQWDGPSESILLARPDANIDRVSSWGTSVIYWNSTDVLEAWRYLNNHVKEVTHKYRSQKIQKQEELDKKLGVYSEDQTVFVEIKQSEERDLFKDSFLYDLIDTARQNLASYSYLLYNKVIAAFNQTDTVKFTMYSQQFLELIKDQDDLLSSRKEFMIGHYLEQAFNLGTTEEEKQNFMNQLKRQYTTWSDFDSPLHDYANKEWSGILNDFYLPRWELYFKNLQEFIVEENKKSERKQRLKQQEEDSSEEEDDDESEDQSENQEEVSKPTKEEVFRGSNIDWFYFEIQFSQNNKTYPKKAVVSEIQVNQRIFQKYYSIIQVEHININQIKPVVQKQYQIRLQPKSNQSYTRFSSKNNKQSTIQEEEQQI